MEGAEITIERLEYVLKAHGGGSIHDQVFCAFLGTLPREDFIPYVADFYLQLEHVKWTIIAGVVNEFGRIDILVNAVGGSTIIAKPSATVEEHSLDDWQRVIRFNLDFG